MPTYTVNDGHRVISGNREYLAGEKVVLSEEAAASLMHRGNSAVEPATRAGRAAKADDKPEPDGSDEAKADESK